jgi:hypothetical protein
MWPTRRPALPKATHPRPLAGVSSSEPSERDRSPYTDPALTPIDSTLLPSRRKAQLLTGAAA